MIGVDAWVNERQSFPNSFTRNIGSEISDLYMLMVVKKIRVILL